MKALIGGRPIHIEVDGGITPETAPQVRQAGADVLVAGSAVFGGGGEQPTGATSPRMRNAADAAVGMAI